MTPTSNSIRTPIPVLQTTCSRAFQEMVETLIVLLTQEHRAAERLVEVLYDRLEAAARGDRDRYLSRLPAEREALTELVLVERERVASITEIGLTLGHRRPSRLRLAELVLYLEPASRDELLELRETLRDVADELETLCAAALTLRRHGAGGLTLYIARELAVPRNFERLVRAQKSDPAGGPGGSAAEASQSADPNACVPPADPGPLARSRPLGESG